MPRVEWIILSAVLLFAMIYKVFTKLFPIVSQWEVQEGREKAQTEATERMRSTCLHERKRLHSID